MIAQHGQDEDRAVARALTTHHSRATAWAFRPIRAVLAAAAVAATALVALTATTAGTAASAATVQPSKALTGLTWHPLTLINGWQSGQSYSTGNPAWAVKNGIVYLSGSLTQPGATPTSNDEFAVLPPAARPSANRQMYLVAYTLNATQGFIGVLPGGALTASSPNPSDAQGFTSL